MRKNLTAAFVDAVKVEKRTDYWDPTLAGFGLRVTEKGAKTWAVFYRHNGLPRKYTVGSYPALSLKDARKEAQKVLRDAALGLDPAAVKKAAREATAGVVTFGALAQQYLDGYAKDRKRSWKEDERMVNGDLAVWKNRPALEISRKDVASLLDGIVKRGAPISANRTLALVSKIFNLAIGRGEVEMNPAFRFPKPAPENPHDRFLTDDEIKKLWKALDDKPARQAAFVKLCLLTAQRAREVLGMAAAEVDFETGIWTIPGARTKNKKEHLVPLGPQAMTLIECVKNGSPFIFPMRGVKPAPTRCFRLWIDDLRTDLKFENDWTCHDLRRTATTGMTKMHDGKPRVTRFLTDRVTNHSDSGVGAIYDRYDYLDEKRDALTRWDARLAVIVSGKKEQSK
jgi:integrase